ncbi:hypothetical protein CSUI_004517 [Cystoisospora suis]|uniref:Uncharacterized protein n=1 Tax=Cystoisospora suis TaxID=483139 RepID=A0A2C6L1A0_9APIC|nr:hypothetical protein CSUI_004517 [Cystoisospora suis]
MQKKERRKYHVGCVLFLLHPLVDRRRGERRECFCGLRRMKVIENMRPSSNSISAA